MAYLKKWWFWVILVIVAFAIAAYIEMSKANAQTDPVSPQVQVPTDVQALTSQLSNAGCNAALNAAANEIIRLRKQVAQLQAAQMQGKSGATKH